MISILYYITGHGYGHAVRSGQVIRSLKQRHPELTIHVKSTVPEWLLQHSNYPVIQIPRAIDVGIVQQDSLQIGLHETVKSCQEMHFNFPWMIEEEIAFIKNNNVRLVLGDVPPLCFEIAASADVPSVAVTNFSWTGIYRGYLQACADFLPLIEEMESFYRKTTLALSLPYPCGMDVFPHRETIPLITRSPALDKTEARDRFGLPRSATVVLLSFGGLGLDRMLLDNLFSQKDFYFVGTGDVLRKQRNLLVLPDADRRYVDLIRASDAVVSKPGYGISADIIRQQIPLLYTNRGEFAEYPYLVQMLDDWATAEFIPQEELISANLTPYLRRLLNKEKNWPSIPMNGASIAAEKIMGLIR